MRFIILFSTILILTFQLSLKGQAILEVNNFERYEEDIELLGSARFVDDILRLTPASPDQVGSCWLKREEVDLKKGFETEFEFRITGQDPSKGGGDGFAFVIQAGTPDLIGQGGDGLGYKGLKNALVIEFDTYDNDEGSANHVNISYYDASKGDFKRHATVHAINELSDGNPHFARVEYKDGQLIYFLDGYTFPVLTSKLDIAKIIGSTDNTAWIGFTSSTSNAYANHDLLKWLYKKKIPPPDIKEDKVAVKVSRTIEVKNRKLKFRVWDNNKEDGDIISLKAGNEWLLSSYTLKIKPLEFDYTLTGFSSVLVLYAHNIGRNPPNTAAIAIIDGDDTILYELESDLSTSDAIELKYVGD